MPNVSRLWRAVLAAALALTPALPAAAQGPEVPLAASAAPTVVLLTMGQGDMVWERFGHNALWVHDPAARTDRVYNYGMFDFYSPGYWGRFVRGNWLYELGVADIHSTLSAYRTLDRTVHAQELALTPEQARALQAFLETNALPENREYRYDYYRDNCSTRVRDALDLVLGGRLRAATEGVATGTTYRWHSERLIAGDPLSYVGLAGGLGPAADREIDRWEEMFLPFAVQARVREATNLDAAGREVPLVAREWTLYSAEGRPAEREAPPFWTPWFLLAGLLLGGALVLLVRGAERSRAARGGFAALASLWLLFAGVGGTILLLLWTATDHAIAYRNENLLQLSPLALPLAVLVPFAVLGARRALHPARLLAAAIAALSVLGFVMQLLPGIDQRNAQILALALPVNLALAWALAHLEARRAPRAAPTAAPPQRRPVAT